MYKVVTKDWWGNIITMVCCQKEVDANVWKKIFNKQNTDVRHE